MILSFMRRLTIILAYVETNQCTCRDMISRALRHAPAVTQKKVWLIYVCINSVQLTHVQMHVHTSIKNQLAT